jgi:predicted Zn-dependent protease
VDREERRVADRERCELRSTQCRRRVDENGRATVIGHEVAHAVAHHGAERASYSMLSQIGAQVVGQVAGAYVPGAQQAISTAYSLGSQYGVLLPYSRTQELEADHLGLLYMARAGYDPREAVGFWMRFAADENNAKPAFEFMSTHPMDDNRIRRLQELMPRALAEYRRGGER